MIDRTDWQAVRDAMIADDRAKLGEPPTAEELLAYERGELSDEEAERVRQLLIAYPELARAYAAPFPSDDGDLSDTAVDRQWNAFRAGDRKAARVLLFWRASAAIAAAMAIVFATMLWRTRTDEPRPHVLPEAVILTPDGRRGPVEEPQYTIRPAGDSVLLVVSIVGPTDYDTYRLDLFDQSHTRIWSSGTLRGTSSNSFNIEVPSRLLRAGTYQVIAYGLRGNEQEAVATYTVAVKRRG